MLKIYDTLSRQKVPFVSITKDNVLFYQCGPTVYWNQHIGNMRAVVMADLIYRSFDLLGYKVNFVRNYTDFGHLTGDNIGDADTGEDRMEKAAKREQLTPKLIADKYIEQYEKDIKSLNTCDPTMRARATDYIDTMIKMIEGLLEKGYAYTTPKAIYFDVSKFPNYYDLSHYKPEKNISGSGHGSISDMNKKNPADFALWFFRTGEHANALQYWKSPFKSSEVADGAGFPGWHIECSAMCLKTLGKTIDIHMGGLEHISIHHTNEIAQSESFNGVKFVNYWIHNGHLTIDNKKISKSEGTSILPNEIVDKGYNIMVLRYFYLQAHYRSMQNFTWESLDAAQSSYQKLSKLYFDLKAKEVEREKIVNEYKEKFIVYIENDFNIPGALGYMWELLKTDLSDSQKLAIINYFNKVFGLKFEKIQQEKAILNDELSALMKERELARQNKDYATADKLRDLIKEKFNFDINDRQIK